MYFEKGGQETTQRVKYFFIRVVEYVYGQFTRRRGDTRIAEARRTEGREGQER